METITSPKNETIKLIRSLDHKKHRADTGLFVAEGPKLLARARTLDWCPKVVIFSDDAPVGDLLTWAEAAGARCARASKRVLEAASNQANPTDCIALFDQRWLTELPAPGRNSLWLILQEIRDPGNLGTIIRTADAISADGVILAGDCCDPYSPDAVRATMGSIFALRYMKIEIAAAAALLRNWPGETIGTAAGATIDYRRAYRLPAMLVMGSEGSGLAPELASACITLARIPMSGGIESLNVAIATALMLYEIRRPNLA